MEGDNVSKSWANIDVLLKQRHDELPKLIEVCKQYMGYEKDTMERIIKARSAVASARENTDIGALGAAVLEGPDGRDDLDEVATAGFGGEVGLGGPFLGTLALAASGSHGARSGGRRRGCYA